MNVELGESQRQLLRDLLEARIIVLEDAKRTIADIPDLALLADEGYALIGEQIALARSALEELA